MRVANIDDIHALDGQIGDQVDFVIAFHPRQLRTMLGIQIGHEKGFHGSVVARLPAFLKLAKRVARCFRKFVNGHGRILPG